MTDEQDYKHDLFISYNRADEEWAERLATRLEQEDYQGRKLKVFFAPWDIPPGEYITESLEEALPQSRKVALIVTSESINGSVLACKIRCCLSPTPCRTWLTSYSPFPAPCGRGKVRVGVRRIRIRVYRCGISVFRCRIGVRLCHVDVFRGRVGAEKSVSGCSGAVWVVKSPCGAWAVACCRGR